MSTPQYVTTGQAAKALGVSERSLRQWAADGLLEPDHRTPGGHARWDVERLRFELRAGIRDRRDRAETDQPGEHDEPGERRGDD